MSAIDTGTTTIPAGTYNGVPVHSSANFSVKYLVSSFRGSFEEFESVLRVDESGNAVLDGKVRADSIKVKDENLAAHLQSPEFFDTEQHPALTFPSPQLPVDGDRATVEGDLTIKGHTERITGTGAIAGPTEDFMGNTKLGLTLDTAIDRTKFGLNWNAPLPKGGFALSNEVKLQVELELIKA